MGEHEKKLDGVFLHEKKIIIAKNGFHGANDA